LNLLDLIRQKNLESEQNVENDQNVETAQNFEKVGVENVQNIGQSPASAPNVEGDGNGENQNGEKDPNEVMVIKVEDEEGRNVDENPLQNLIASNLASLTDWVTIWALEYFIGFQFFEKKWAINFWRNFFYNTNCIEIIFPPFFEKKKSKFDKILL